MLLDQVTLNNSSCLTYSLSDYSECGRSVSPMSSIFKKNLFRILRNPPFVNHKGKDVTSDWLANQWDERSVLGHAQFYKGRMKGLDPDINTAQTPKRFGGVWLFWRISEGL